LNEADKGETHESPSLDIEGLRCFSSLSLYFIVQIGRDELEAADLTRLWDLRTKLRKDAIQLKKDCKISESIRLFVRSDEKKRFGSRLVS
jgi:hypothetical protein